jgi:hypothetical protein
MAVVRNNEKTVSVAKIFFMVLKYLLLLIFFNQADSPKIDQFLRKSKHFFMSYQPGIIKNSGRYWFLR